MYIDEFDAIVGSTPTQKTYFSENQELVGTALTTGIVSTNALLMDSPWTIGNGRQLYCVVDIISTDIIDTTSIFNFNLIVGEGISGTNTTPTATSPIISTSIFFKNSSKVKQIKAENKLILAISPYTFRIEPNATDKTWDGLYLLYKGTITTGTKKINVTSYITANIDSIYPYHKSDLIFQA